MKNIKLVFLLLFGLIGGLKGQMLLGIQYMQSSFTAQAGFQPVVIASNVSSISQTFSGLTGIASGSVTVVTTQGNGNNGYQDVLARNRTTVPSSGSFTYGSLYSGILAVQAGGGIPAETSCLVTLSGLDPSTQYSVSVYSYDSSAAAGTTYTSLVTNMTAGGGGNTASSSFTNPGPTAAANIAATFSSSTSNDIFAATLLITSDSLGNLSFSESELTGGNKALMNGFTINTVAVPEPSVVVLLGMAMAGLLFFLPRLRLGLNEKLL